MIENKKIHPNSKLVHQDFLQIIEKFQSSGTVIDDRGRNLIKTFEVKNQIVNVKSFKTPHLINQIAYKYFRKSKAERSFEYACILQEKKINTPQPLAYYTYSNILGLTTSYYFSHHLKYDFTYRELREKPRLPDFEHILRAFTKFTFDLHEKGVFFKDHSAGNTLIVKHKENYDFYLIDLNRMGFYELDFDARMKNFAKLTEDDEMVKITSDTYAKLIHQPYTVVYHKMWEEIHKFRKKYNRRTKAKAKYLK